MATEAKTPCILHADMDAFYASVEQRDQPGLRGQPVVVGGLGPRGVVSAASYEARAFGVRSAMPGRKAQELCPQAHFVRGRMEVYVAVSRQIREVFARFTPLVEPLSLDEAFLDVTDSQALFGDGEAIARRLREEVRAEVDLSISVGVASSKFVAKVASDQNKPDGLTLVPPGRELEFLAPLPVGRLWGIGPQAQKRLHDLGYRCIADLQALDLPAMEQLLGEGQGEQYWQLCRGIDARAVDPEREIKSISQEETFARDLRRREDCEAVLLELSERVGRRLRRQGLKGQVLRLKLRDPDFKTHSRQRRLPLPSWDDLEIYRVARELFGQLRPQMRPVRLLGVGMAELRDPTRKSQGQLFGVAEAEGQQDLLRAMDAIKDRFGEAAIRRAGSRGRRQPREPD